MMPIVSIMAYVPPFLSAGIENAGFTPTAVDIVSRGQGRSVAKAIKSVPAMPACASSRAVSAEKTPEQDVAHHEGLSILAVRFTEGMRHAGDSVSMRIGAFAR
jgi:hypothetical protein